MFIEFINIDKKKKGSILIESIISIAIISTMLLIVTLLITQNKKSIILRKEIEFGNRVVYCLMQEIKYNIPFDEIKNSSYSGNLHFKNYDNIINDLREKDLLVMEKGSDINIYVNNYYNDKLYLSIELYDSNNKLIVERNFIKFKWMDFYE